MSKPFLSVLIDTYNHERYIEQTVVSAIEQDFPAADYEILVVDDGSTDSTAGIVRRFEPRVRLLSKKNGGQASAFNLGIRESRGEIIAFLDGDDWWVPRKLTAVMTALEQHPEAVAVGHGYYDFHGEGNEAQLCALGEPKFLSFATPETAREAYACWQFFLTSAVTVRRSLLQKCMPIPEVLTFCADAPISIGALAQGAWVLAQPLSYYRHHSGNLVAPSVEERAKRRQRQKMGALTFDLVGPIVVRLGARPDSVAAFLNSWAEMMRSFLRERGGDRLETFRTEMRVFRTGYADPGLVYQVFKYLFVGGAALLLPPRSFYRARDWYARRNLGRLREQFARARYFTHG